MFELFTKGWMNIFKEEWNKDPELTAPLASINFDSNICYGFKNEENPRGFIMVKHGSVVSSGSFDEFPSDTTINWDLRATPESWDNWCKGGLSMWGIGAAYMTGELQFKHGDYSAMMHNPYMAGPFIHSFATMHKVWVEAHK